MIKTIIFDIGKVLMDYDFGAFVQKLYPDSETAEKVTEALFGEGRWDEVDRGVLSDCELRASFVSAAPQWKEEILYAYEHIGDGFRPMPYAKDWIRSLKEQGFQVLYLSNYSTHAMASNWKVLDFLSLMDGGVFSCDAKLLKPDREIYEWICRKYDLVPAECVFFDDKQENVDAAAAYGMHAILFKDYEQTKGSLECVKKTLLFNDARNG